MMVESFLPRGKACWQVAEEEQVGKIDDVRVRRIYGESQIFSKVNLDHSQK
jgi:hypothetical protein